MSTINSELEKYISENIVSDDLIAITWSDVLHHKGKLNWKNYVLVAVIIILSIFSEKLIEFLTDMILPENLANILSLPIIITVFIGYIIFFLLRWHYQWIKPKTKFCIALTDSSVFVLNVNLKQDKVISVSIEKEILIKDITIIKHYLTNLLSSKWHIELGSEEIYWLESKNYWNQNYLLNKKGSSLSLFFNKLCSTSCSDFNWNSLTISMPQKFVINTYGLIVFLLPFIFAGFLGYTMGTIRNAVNQQTNPTTTQREPIIKKENPYNNSSVSGREIPKKESATSEQKEISNNIISEQKKQTLPKTPNPTINATPKYPKLDLSTNLLTDLRDNQIYKTKILNGKRWIVQDMNYNVKGSLPGYDNTYRLYTFNESKIACPLGYHTASRSEWKDMMQKEISPDFSKLKLINETNYFSNLDKLQLTGGYQKQFNGSGERDNLKKNIFWTSTYRWFIWIDTSLNTYADDAFYMTEDNGYNDKNRFACRCIED